MSQILRGPHELVAIVLDLGCRSKKEATPATFSHSALKSSSPFSIAKCLIQRYVSQKLIFEQSDKIGLLTIGVKESDHPLSDREGYDHIAVEVSLGQPHGVLLRSLTHTHAASKYKGDVLSAVVVAMTSIDNFAKATKGINAAVAKKIAVFTDLSHSECDADDADTIASVIRDRNFELIVIDCNQQSERQEMECLKSFCRIADGAFAHWTDFASALMKPRRKRVTATTKSRVSISFADKLRIPCFLYLGTKEETLPTAKKESIYQQEDEEDEEDLLSDRTPAKVTMSRTYYAKKTPNAERDEDEEVEPEHKAKAYLYGKNLIPVSAAEESLLAMPPAEKQLTVIGTISASESEACWFVRQCEVIVPEPGNAAAQMGLCLLVRGLRKSHRVIVARYIWRANVNPKLVVLTPESSGASQTSADSAQLLLNYVPFAEDVKLSLDLPGLPVPTRQQQDLMNKFVLSMSLVRALKSESDGISPASPEAVDDDSNIEMAKEFLDPRSTYNPALQLFYSFAQERLIHGNDCELPEAPGAIARTLEVPGSVLSTSTVLENMKVQFPLTPAKIKADERKKVWKAAQLARKRAMPEITINEILGENEERDLSDFHVEPSDPQRTFDRLVSKKDTMTTQRALEELAEIIIDKLIDSFVSADLVAGILDLVELHQDTCEREKREKYYDQLVARLVGVCLMDKRNSKHFVTQFLARDKVNKISKENYAVFKQIAAGDFATVTSKVASQQVAVVNDEEDFEGLE